jgi:hypothetical protein
MAGVRQLRRPLWPSLEYPETPRYAHIAKAMIDGIETAHRIRKGQLDDRSISDYKQFMELAA